jgi:nicotinamide-nucleotide amidase
VTQPRPSVETAKLAVGLLAARSQTVATAESLTGGLVAAALTTVPGASAVFRGGIVAYAADLKHSLLGVAPELLARVGTVHQEVALAMARGARDHLSADVGLATTGVAGPDPADGQPIGTVHIAVASANSTMHARLSMDGTRAEIRQATVDHVLELLVRALMEAIA